MGYLVLATVEARVGQADVATAPLSVLLDAEEGRDLRAGDDAGALSAEDSLVCRGLLTLYHDA